MTAICSLRQEQGYVAGRNWDGHLICRESGLTVRRLCSGNDAMAFAPAADEIPSHALAVAAGTLGGAHIWSCLKSAMILAYSF